MGDSKHRTYPAIMPWTRKRRRQQYHARNAFGAKKSKATKRTFKGRKTKDSGEYGDVLKPTRRVITIEEKLEVVRFYEELRKTKKAAKERLLHPYPRDGTKAQKKQHREEVLAARAELKRNLQRECKNKFPVLGKSQVIKWARAAKAERWAELPEVVRKKQGATTNEWRSKIEGIPPKGRPLGGQIPMSLQKELDVLISEMSMGRSVVSERREVVTADCIVAWNVIVNAYVSLHQALNVSSTMMEA